MTSARSESVTSFRPSADWKVLLWLGLIAFVPYLDVLQNDFVWDDTYFILKNYTLRQPLLVLSSSFEYAPSFFIPLRGRAVMALSLALDVGVWGVNPFGFHLTNLLLHTLNVLLVYGLARLLSRRNGFAPLAGLLFAFHPVHGEAVASLLGRSDLMITSFALLSLLAYHRFLREVRPVRRLFNYALVLLLFVASCWTKESGIVLPLLLILTENAVWSGEGKRRSLRDQVLTMIPFLVLGLSYLWLRGRVIPDTGQALWGGGRWQTAILMGIVVWKYAVSLVFPFFYSPYYLLDWPAGWDLWRVFAGGTVVLACGAIGLISLRRFPLIGWGLAWMAINLLPFSNILIPIPGAMMAQRWLYLPSAGFCIVLAWLVHVFLSRSSLARRRAFLGVGAMALVLLAWKITAINSIWRDDGSLFQRILREHPQSALAHNNLGDHFFRKGELRKAEEEYHQALRLDPKSPEIHANLGHFYYARGDLGRAEAQFRRAALLNPKFTSPWLGLALIVNRKGEPDSALALYRRVLQLNPFHPLALNDAGVILLSKHDWDGAEECFQRALSVYPSDTLTQRHLRMIRELRGSQVN